MRANLDQSGHANGDLAAAIGPADQAISLRQTIPLAKFFQCEDISIARLALRVSDAMAGDLVVCRTGVDDPVALAAQALARGAAGVLTEQILPCPLPQAVVADAVEAACQIANRIERNPAAELLTIGVIGDAGKTSTAMLIAGLLKRIGVRTAFETELGSGDGIVQSVPTAALSDGIELISRLAAARDAGCGAMVIDLSGVAPGSSYDVRWDMLVITGADAGPGTSMARSHFGPDPLTLALEQAKQDAVVILPSDRPKLVRRVADAGLHCLTYGLRRPADLSAKVFDEQPGETTLLVSCGDETALMRTGHCGEAFALNSLAAIAVGRLLETPLATAVDHVAKLPTIPGRMQRLSSWDTAAVVIDAAGTPERVSGTLRTLRRQRVRGGKLWCVLVISDPGSDAVAALVDADRFSRFGRAVERFADRVVLTSAEDFKPTFLASAHAVLDGFQDVAAARLVADQARAIGWAVRHAAPEDTIVIFTGDQCRTPSARRLCAQNLERVVEEARQDPAVRHRTETSILKMPRAV